MIIYVENQVRNFSLVKKILNKYSFANVVFIKNYKNIFDKTIPYNVSQKPNFILAKLNSTSILKAPDGYWHNNKVSFFLKTSIGCVFDCSYCYLKWAFKNDIPVYFVNYDDIKNEIKQVVEDKSLDYIESEFKDSSNESYEFKLKTHIGYKDKIWFYSGDYSDILWMNHISNFIEEFVPFFENFDNAMLEIRTKSSNIKPLLDLWFVPKNTEIAFSLNPQILIDKYEKWTSSLKDRIKAINLLLEKWYKVWLRFLPLLPVENYQDIYKDFVDFLKKEISFNKISSIFASGLLYTHEDYKQMLKKKPYLDVLYKLTDKDEFFIREPREYREFFYDLFEWLVKNYFICLDEK